MAVAAAMPEGTAGTAAQPVRKMAPRIITLMTIGSRGDVQPLVALGKGLKKDGHTVRIATHEEFGQWIQGHGLEFRPLAGNPAELLELMTQHTMFSPNFVRKAVSGFYTWFDELLQNSWEACQGSEMIIATPYAFAGYHIAEAMGIPFVYVCPFPWTRTRAFPQPLITPETSLGGSYNAMSHTLLDTLTWRTLGSKINSWRKKTLHLPHTSQGHGDRWPMIYAFSRTLIPPPPDWSDWIHICGFFFLDNPNPDWKPDEKLSEFLADRSKKIVYIGFGSIVVDDPEGMTNAVVEAVRLAGVKAILAKGWSGRSAANTANAAGAAAAPPRTYPDFIFPLTAVPHDWLFPKIDGVVHHGGAGTTAAGLRAGLPTIVKPFFGDQFFWGERITSFGLGVVVRDLTAEKLAAALTTITTDARMRKLAKEASQMINAETGVQEAIHSIYRDMPYVDKLTAELRERHANDAHSRPSNDTGGSTRHTSVDSGGVTPWVEVMTTRAASAQPTASALLPTPADADIAEHLSDATLVEPPTTSHNDVSISPASGSGEPTTSHVMDLEHRLLVVTVEKDRLTRENHRLKKTVQEQKEQIEALRSELTRAKSHDRTVAHIRSSDADGSGAVARSPVLANASTTPTSTERGSLFVPVVEAARRFTTRTHRRNRSLDPTTQPPAPAPSSS